MGPAVVSPRAAGPADPACPSFDFGGPRETLRGLPEPCDLQ